MLLNCVLKKCIESPLVSKEIKPVNPKGNQPWIFIGKTDAEAPILWPPDAKSQFIGKDPDAGKDWGQEEKGMTDGEMVGWHHWLSGHEFEQTLGDSKGQGSLVCCSPWGCKKSDTTEHLNNNEPIRWTLLITCFKGMTDKRTMKKQNTEFPFETIVPKRLVLLQIGSLLFSCSVIPNSLWPHEPQHTRLLCPSVSPGVCSNSCPLSW